MFTYIYIAFIYIHSNQQYTNAYLFHLFCQLKCVFFIAKYTSCILIYTAGDSNLIISDADPIDVCTL